MKRLLNQLKANNIAHTVKGEWQQEQDGYIELTNSIHMSVGKGYYSLVENLPNGSMLFAPPFTTIDQVVKATKYVLSKGTVQCLIDLYNQRFPAKK